MHIGSMLTANQDYIVNKFVIYLYIRVFNVDVHSDKSGAFVAFATTVHEALQGMAIESASAPEASAVETVVPSISIGCSQANASLERVTTRSATLYEFGYKSSARVRQCKDC